MVKPTKKNLRRIEGVAEDALRKKHIHDKVNRDFGKAGDAKDAKAVPAQNHVFSIDTAGDEAKIHKTVKKLIMQYGVSKKPEAPRSVTDARDRVSKTLDKRQLARKRQEQADRSRADPFDLWASSVTKPKPVDPPTDETKQNSKKPAMCDSEDRSTLNDQVISIPSKTPT
eukprot:Selendium_serpulae@DN5309_c0_g1_i1.p1